jgi:hypothetical protein
LESTKPETYAQLRARQQKETDDFPMFFAFSNKQFAEGMQKFGLSPDDTDKIYKLGNTGGYYLRTDAEQLHAMFDRHGQELATAMKDAAFAAEAFRYELNNHEYCITHDSTDTLAALGLTEEDLANDKALNSAFGKAKNQYWSDYEAWERDKKKPQASLLDKVAKNQKKVDAYKEANPPDNGKGCKKSTDALE